MKTDFFGTNNSDTTTKAIDIIDNFNGVDNKIMYNVFDSLYSMWKLTKLILDAHDGKITPDEDPEDLRGMTSEEIASLMYSEELDGFDKSFAENLSKDLLYSAYFKPNYATEMFATAVYNLTELFRSINGSLFKMVSYELDPEIKERLRKYLYDLNYGILVNFKLMSYKENQILNCVQYYVVKNNITVESIAEPMFEIYKEHKPELPYLNNHPELFTKLEEYIPYTTLLDLIAYSDVVTEDEWNAMLPDENGKIKLEPDQLFFDELEARFAEDVGSRFLETVEGE